MKVHRKTVRSDSGNSAGRFPLHYHERSNIKNLLTVIAWGINSVRSYLYEFIDAQRFYQTGHSFSKKNRNFPKDYENSDGASDASLLRLAQAYGIEELTFSRIFFEWESKFLPRTTEAGISEFVRLFFKYELVDRYMPEEQAEEIAAHINTSVHSWYDSTVSGNDNVYFYNDNDVLTLYVEVSIPSAYGRHFAGMSGRVKRLLPLLYNVIVPTAKIEFLEVSWRDSLL